MNKKMFTELTGEKPEDVLGSDYKNTFEEYKDKKKIFHLSIDITDEDNSLEFKLHRIIELINDGYTCGFGWDLREEE